MDLYNYDALLWKLLRADEEGPERKLKELLYELPLPDRITFLRFILIEYKNGSIRNKLGQRIEYEEPPSYFFHDPPKHLYDHLDSVIEPWDSVRPGDMFYLHIGELSDVFDDMCTVVIPGILKAYEREVADLQLREIAFGKLNIKQDDVDVNEELLSSVEAAKYLGIELSTLYSYNHKGLLKPYTRGGKLLQYSKSQLNKFRKLKQ